MVGVERDGMKAAPTGRGSRGPGATADTGRAAQELSQALGAAFDQLRQELSRMPWEQVRNMLTTFNQALNLNAQSEGPLAQYQPGSEEILSFWSEGLGEELTVRRDGR